MVDRLTETRPLDEAMGAAWPAPTPALAVRIAGDVRVLALRHLAAGAAAIEAVLAACGGAALPAPGVCLGDDPWLVWTGPTECLMLTSKGAMADGMLQALAPGKDALAYALDQSAGSLVIECLGPGVVDVLPRLFDASGVPGRAGQGGRTRMMDIGAVLLRLGPERVWVVVDRVHGGHAARWLTHGGQPGAIEAGEHLRATEHRHRDGADALR